MLSGEQDAAVSAHTAPGRCVTKQRLLSPECARLLAPSHSGLSENPGHGGRGARLAPLPVADADPLLPHGVEQHGDAVQGLSDVRHGHSGAGPPQAEEQLLDVADAARQEDDGLLTANNEEADKQNYPSLQPLTGRSSFPFSPCAMVHPASLKTPSPA